MNWVRTPQPSDWLVYLPYVNRHDLLSKALESLGDSIRNTVVVDQGGDAVHSGPLFRWTEPRRFTAVMNWIRRDALARNLTYYLFMHSDATAAPDGIAKLLGMAKQLDKDGRKWGVIFTHYDAIALFNPKADIGPWDESFMWYVADVDYYNRLLWEGWEHHHLPEVCAGHVGSQTLPSLPDKDRSEVKSNHDWSLKHYRHKWGAEPHTGTRNWSVPYNGKP